MPTFQQKNALAGVSAATTADVATGLAGLLLANFTRVADLFNAWDTNNDGKISRREFCRAVKVLGLNATDEETTALYDSFDRDGSDSVELNELNALLRQGNTVQLAAVLQPGARGAIETEAKNVHELRTTADSHRFTAEWGPVAAAEVPGRIKQLLERKHERLMNIFAEWDTDGNGIVSRGEFCAALRRLGLDLSDGDLVWLFECFDEDGGGSIDAAEFAHLVHSAASSRALSSLRARTLKQQGYRPTEAQMAKLRLLQSAAARGQAALLTKRQTEALGEFMAVARAAAREED